MYTIRLKAVDSRYVTDNDLKAADIQPHEIPMGADGVRWRLAAHQVETIRVLREENGPPIIINQAMTGDGKTLAGRFQLLSQGTKWRTFAMYPTNELAHDQNQSFDELLNMWHPPEWEYNPDTVSVSAQRLDEFEGLQDFSRFERLEELLQSDYIMTNPDIFHHIMTFGYDQYGTAHDLMPRTLASWYRLFVFDEFHLFGIEQVCSVLTAILLLQKMKPAHKAPRFLFLSATPQYLLRDLAQQVGLEVQYIQGNYQHGRSLMSTHRRILQEVKLSLHEGDLEDWIKTHFDDVIKPFFDNNRPAVKGLIIVDSVA